MIITLPDTDTRNIARSLVDIRDTGGEVTTGRVLTLIVLLTSEDDAESAIAAANGASQEHPCRVLVLITCDDAQGDPNLDAEIRVGGDAGASEVVVMWLSGEVARHLESVVTPLLLPDTPIVAWWPFSAPDVPSAAAVGRIAHRRITDALSDPDPDALHTRRTGYNPGDSDLTWARLTPWRGMLASSLDLPPHHTVVGATVRGPGADPSVDLAAGWLADRLGVTVTREATSDPADQDRPPVTWAELTREQSAVQLEVIDGTTARVRIDGRPDVPVALTPRDEVDLLSEELRHLDPDTAYAKALRGLARVRRVEVA